LTNPFEGQQRAEQAGAKLFARECAACHGRDGSGIGKAPPLNQGDVREAPAGALFCCSISIGRTLIALAQGDEEHARQTAAMIQLDPQHSYLGMTGFLVARYGPSGAEKGMSAAEQPGPLGEIALKEGRFAEAVTLLQRALNVSYRKQLPAAQWVAEGLVTALQQSGNSQKALEVLESISTTWLCTPPLAAGHEAFWLRNQARLSTYYHRIGRQAEARKIDDQLRKSLELADPDHPILRQLNGR
jgi:tetratricopeptide (TPR) repeat protein